MTCILLACPLDKEYYVLKPCGSVFRTLDDNKPYQIPYKLSIYFFTLHITLLIREGGLFIVWI